MAAATSFSTTVGNSSRVPPLVAAGLTTLTTTSLYSPGTTVMVPASTLPAGPARAARTSTVRFEQVIRGGSMIATGTKTASWVAKAIPDGVVSNHLVHHLTPGQMIHLGQADGDFVLPDPLPTKRTS